MNTRIEDTLAAASSAYRFVKQRWPTETRTSPLLFVAVAGAGVAMGIGAGLLLAPQTGSQLRASLLERTHDFVGSLRTRVADVVNAAEEVVGAKEDDVTRRNGATPPRPSALKPHVPA